MRRLIPLLGTVVLAIATAACGDQADVPAANSLTGTIWRLTELNGQPSIPHTMITAEFFADGRVAGSSGCNNYMAAYEIDGESIAINMSPAASTRMACPEPVMAQEEAYLAALDVAATYEVSEDSLILYDSSGNPVTVFAAVSQDLAGTSWEVISYNNGQGGVVTVLSGTTLTANFGEDEELSGNAGCNEYTGTYEADGESIKLVPFGTTRKNCPEPEGVMQQESAYLAALETAASYSFDGMTLNMRTVDGATAVNFQPPASSSGSPSVSGAVTQVDNAPIPEGATLTVQIQDTSLQDVAATVIGEQIIENPGQFPIPYQVGYDPNDITNPRYTMSARITAADGSLLFINDTAIPVITAGNPTEDVEIPVIQVGG